MSSMENKIMKDLSSKYAIEIFNLTKDYPIKNKNKFIRALDNVNLKIKKGEIFGLLGPNGAGKTTIVSILTTLLQPTSGYATILGLNILKEPWFVRENVGLMLGGDMIYLRLTGYRNLKFFCKLYGIKNYDAKIKEILEKFNLLKWSNQYVAKYSKGMKLKLALARVLLINPKVLFLDEPMLGLDPKSLNEVINILKNLETTIFLTSHQMDVVSRMCNRIAFLKEGKIIKVDTQENFKKLISEKIRIQVKIANDKNKFIESLNKKDFLSDITVSENTLSFNIESRQYFPNLFDILKDFPIVKFDELTPSLDDVFIKLAS